MKIIFVMLIVLILDGNYLIIIAMKLARLDLLKNQMFV